jgi:hypothetical protein
LKTLFALILVGFISICPVTAQVTFGIKGGPNFSFMNIEDGIHYSFHAGIFSETALSDVFFLRPELLYSEKGSRPTDLSAYDLYSSLVYLSMPVLVGLKVTDRFSIMTGPELNYLLDGSSYTYDDTKSISSEEYASWDVAVDFGLAYRISKKFSAELRYGLGLVDVIDIMFEDIFNRPAGSAEEGKNRTLQLSVGYILGATDKGKG